jgi:hypothetical protein
LRDLPRQSKVAQVSVSHSFDVDEEAFRGFLAALDGSPPELTTANMNDLFLLCEEFGFASLLSQISDFRSQHAVVDDEARKRVSRVEEQNLQQDRVIGVLQRELSDLRAAHSRLAAESASVEETNKVLEDSVCLLQKEIAELRGGHAREIAALSARLPRRLPV